MAIETWSRGPAVWFTPLASGSHFSSLCRIRPLKMRAQSGMGRQNWNRGLAQLVRATVSKTVGREFESLSPCQFLPSARSVSKAQPPQRPISSPGAGWLSRRFPAVNPSTGCQTLPILTFSPVRYREGDLPAAR